MKTRKQFSASKVFSLLTQQVQFQGKYFHWILSKSFSNNQIVSIKFPRSKGLIAQTPFCAISAYCTKLFYAITAYCTISLPLEEALLHKTLCLRTSLDGASGSWKWITFIFSDCTLKNKSKSQ